MKKNRLTTLLLLLSVLLNVYFIRALYKNHSVNKPKVINESWQGFKFNAVSAHFFTHANFLKNVGYFSRLNDTITIQPFLKVDFIYRKSINLYPLISLYEFSKTDSNFKLIDTIRYQGNNSLKFVNKDTCSQLLFYSIDLPFRGKIDKFKGAFELHTEMSGHNMSPPIKVSVAKQLIDKFYKN